MRRAARRSSLWRPPRRRSIPPRLLRLDPDDGFAYLPPDGPGFAGLGRVAALEGRGAGRFAQIQRAGRAAGTPVRGGGPRRRVARAAFLRRLRLRAGRRRQSALERLRRRFVRAAPLALPPRRRRRHLDPGLAGLELVSGPAGGPSWRRSARGREGSPGCRGWPPERAPTSACGRPAPASWRAASRGSPKASPRAGPRRWSPRWASRPGLGAELDPLRVFRRLELGAAGSGATLSSSAAATSAFQAPRPSCWSPSDGDQVRSEALAGTCARGESLFEADDGGKRLPRARRWFWRPFWPASSLLQPARAGLDPGPPPAAGQPPGHPDRRPAARAAPPARAGRRGSIPRRRWAAGRPRRRSSCSPRSSPSRAGWYAGPVGYFDHRGNGELRVALRSGLLRGRHATAFAGAGIVAGSEPGRRSRRDPRQGRHRARGAGRPARPGARSPSIHPSEATSGIETGGPPGRPPRGRFR